MEHIEAVAVEGMRWEAVIRSKAEEVVVGVRIVVGEAAVVVYTSEKGVVAEVGIQPDHIAVVDAVEVDLAVWVEALVGRGAVEEEAVAQIE